MDLVTSNIRFALHALLAGEEGEDLVEYAMIAALMALGAAAGMDSVSTGINQIFTRLGEILYVALG
jgi:pilus assembly protein Flp/PilA